MKREIIQTADGSSTIHLPDFDECYHSKHGAIQEAQHVFIKNGFNLFASGEVGEIEQSKPIAILEIGFGTGLNAFITFLEAQRKGQPVHYIGVEAYPVVAAEIARLNYVAALQAQDQSEIFMKMHDSDWETEVLISEAFHLTKRKQFFDDIDDVAVFDLIYFDAFGYQMQPELWRTEIFQKMHTALKPGGILVTYAARGVVKRSMQEVGFTVQKLAGPPGKREMFRARKAL